MNEICPKDYCTGCTACVSICRSKAITMLPDCYGFLYPSIDSSKCINCQACKNVCPINREIHKLIPLSGYVCHAKSIDEQLTSTSGGVMAVISRYILNNGGIVYGCEITNQNEVKHIRITNESALYKLKGSKYVQSNLTNIYNLVKQDLTNGITVLFSGTPCQIAGLRSFLRKDYPLLYTIDFVCHGVPSPLFLKEAISSIQSERNIIDATLQFRHKHISRYHKYLPSFVKCRLRLQSTYGLHFVNAKGQLICSETYPRNNYILGFLTGLTYRESCYHCKFASSDRVSDFTCGDFYDKTIKISLPRASCLLSMLSLNSQKAENLFVQIQDSIEAQKIDYSVIVRTHRQLREPMPRHPLRNQFLESYSKFGFEKSMNLVMGNEKKCLIRNQWLDKVVGLVNVIPFVNKLRNKLRNKRK